MSFSVMFGTTNKRVNSTLRPTLSTSINVNLKSGTSTEAPTFEIQGSVDFGWNYCYCETFKRYYWINNITYEKSVYYISCSCDYLASYKDDILTNTCYIDRADSIELRDTSLTDMLFPCRATPVIAQTTFNMPAELNANTIIVSIVGASGSVFYSLTVTEFQRLCNFLYGADYLDVLNNKLGTPTDVAKEIARPNDYIQSATWVPFIPKSTDFANISLGYVDTGIEGGVLSNGVIQSFDITVAIPRSADSNVYIYRQVEPFACYSLTIPCIGTVPISARELFGKTNIVLSYKFDVSGGCNVTIRADDRYLCTVNGNVGVPVAISARETNTVGMLSAISSAFDSAMTGNILGAAAGVISATQTAIPRVISSGGSGGCVMGQQMGALTATFLTQTVIDGEHFGYPVCKYTSLSSISGYCKTANASIETAATENGKSQIEALLNGGVYIE